MKRRSYLSGLAATGGLAAGSGLGAGAQSLARTRQTGDSYHPGPPRFMRADERLVDPLEVDYRRDGGPDGRNTLAPQVPDPERDPDNYGPDAFTWRVAETPTDSDVDGFYESPDEYDYEGDNVVEFEPDVPGVYTLELDAPDGTHELTVRVFPEPPESASGRPRVNPEASHEEGTFRIDANPAAAPDSGLGVDDLDVEFYVDDRDALADSALSVDGTTATVDAADVQERTRIYAVASGEHHSVSQVVALDPDGGVDHVDQPPAWIENATMYEIFVRSFGSEAGEADFQYLTDRLDYIDELGIDVIWLTPIVEAASHREDRAGGPHGYDTINYFDTADALGSMADFEAFVDACHDRDIRVCFDLVINHVDYTHPFFEDAEGNMQASKYFDWFEREADGSPNNYFGWETLMNVNYQNVATREHILAAADFWSRRVDGFRCDIAYGVTHDFWKEVREVVTANDADFFMLDETIPYQAGFAEQEFDMHFDNELHAALVEVGRGGVDASEILEAVQQRRNEGVPDSQVFLQYIENHDTRRYLDVNDLAAEKAAAAATFTLPGIPMVYYGAERAIANRAEPRLDEKGHFRSFMNWDDYDEEHLAFYKALSGARDEVDALQFDADLVGAYYRADSERVVAYGRDAGEQQVVVVLNFDAEPRTVELRGPVGTTDLVSGSDIGVESEGDTTEVEVDSVAVLETPSLSGLGTHVAGVDDEAGDDSGAGDASYPADVADGALDLTGFDLYETGQDYQFRVTVDGPVENSADFDGGFADQHLQVYVRDPTETSGSPTAREGLNAELTEPYQYRIVGDGENGARVETPEGEFVAEGDVFASPSTGSIRLDVPKRHLPADLGQAQLAVAMAGYDSSQPGNVAQVASAGPQVLDIVTPEGVSNATALGDSGSGIPYVILGNPLEGELVERFEDATGDDHGPGSYIYPTGEEFRSGALDVESVAVYDDGDRYRFAYSMAGELTNPMDGAYGFSLQHLQVYVADPSAGGPTATAGREGTNVAFADPYHYRIVAAGFEDAGVVEDASGSVVTEDVRVAAYRSMDTITVSVPKSAVGEGLDSASIAPLVLGYDAEGPGGVRQVAAEADETTFGGGSDGDDPAVIDMITPKSADQSAVLDAGDALPSLSLAGFSGDLIDSWTDETGDDHGPGSYTYPGSDQIPDGAYDITRLELYETGDRYRFVYYVDGAIENPWSSDLGFSVHNFQVYIRDPAAEDAPTATEARQGVGANLAEPYHYRLMVNAFEIQALEGADGSTVSQDVAVEAFPEMNAVAMEVPAEAMAGDIREMEIAPLILGHDSYGQGLVRNVAAESADWTFGGGSPSSMNHQVIDMITAEGVSQSEALSFSADQRASIPFAPVSGDSAAGGSDSGSQDSERSDGSQDSDGSGSDSSDSQGTTTTDEPSTTATTAEPTTTDGATVTGGDTTAAETTAGSDAETDDGSGPGFGAVSGVLGTAGGAAYAARRLLDSDDRPVEVDTEGGADTGDESDE